ncbi:MAG: NUDIX domain-containing protein [Staphylococcus warneri]|uniref:NUDIX hydrolase n=1 Tax=Staphylococcus TaxID=1279 RepID=UPI00091EF69C|nr:MULTISPECIES: NUDIX domain-containing protein [Staphylococcus]MBF2232802.1 NUDIX domain-containing protein [Staphylococcus epidermidis]MCF7582250.1 NUDIX domain-containing protein [Staphylococcus epidermidis]MCG2193587.1 NUDIX domain-containing protein [Staphylococcus epidermidis]MCM3483482.1 NUDIX domain-containing protein [Staphylococcus warneri]MCR4501856.1 NUDIX domain-containing protein [Staphylococcus warneri]
MKVYNCANLLYVKNNYILLVKVRNNEKYYLPGGKIEKNENSLDALIRELNEELNIRMSKETFNFVCSIEDVAYPDNQNSVILNCYHSDVSSYNLIKSNEITDIKMIALEDKHLMAPAVVKIVKLIEKGVVNV